MDPYCTSCHTGGSPQAVRTPSGSELPSLGSRPGLQRGCCLARGYASVEREWKLEEALWTGHFEKVGTCRFFSTVSVAKQVMEGEPSPITQALSLERLCGA